MAKKPSSTAALSKKPGSFQSAFLSARKKQWQRKAKLYRPHRSFRRSYREDYHRDLNIPGPVTHAMQTFQIIFKQWRLFLPLIVLAVISNVLLVGLMNEDAYNAFQSAIEETNQNYAGGQLGNFAKAGLTLISIVGTGGLSQGLTEVQVTFAFIIFLIVWLVTVYILRNRLAGRNIKLRDALYNALAPLIPTAIILLIILIEIFPITLTIVIHSAAVSTDFLSTPFYALVFFIFAALMVTLSLYLLANSFMALVAVTAPGLYPMRALSATSNLIMGRRINLMFRLVFLIFIIAVIYTVVMLPLILLDMWAKSTFDWSQGIPFVSLYLLFTSVFVFIYAATYFYLYYRRILNYDQSQK